MTYPVEFFESTIHAVPRFRSTQGQIEDTGVIISDNGDLHVPGHLVIGDGDIAIRYASFSGYTNPLQGGEHTFAHNIENFTSILSVGCMVFFSENGCIPPEYTRYNGYQYSIRITNDLFVIDNSSINSAKILNKPYKSYLVYTKEVSQ